MPPDWPILYSGNRRSQGLTGDFIYYFGTTDDVIGNGGSFNHGLPLEFSSTLVSLAELDA